MLTRPALLLSGLLPLMISPALDASEDWQWDGQLAAGMLSSSNLSVIELEQVSQQSDQALTASAQLNAQWQPTTNAYVDLGGSVSSRRYQTLDEYNLQLRSVFIDSSYAFTPLTLGVYYQHTDATLGSQRFLSQQQVGFYGSKVLKQQFYVRAGLMFSDKSFQQFAGRNADNLELQLDLYWFTGKHRRMVALSYRRAEDKTADARYRYTADKLTLQLAQPFTLAGAEHRFRLGGHVEQRHYPNYAAVTASQRHDQQQIIDVSLQFSLSTSLTLLLSSEWAKYRSNLDSANYQEATQALSLALAF